MLNKELEDSVFILNVLSNEIEHYTFTAKKVIHEKHENQDSTFGNVDILMHGCLLYSIIKVCAFLDEWNDHLSSLIGKGVERDRIIKVKKITKPAISKVNEYSGLRDYRNWLLAHNSRVQREQDENAYRGNYITQLKVPILINDYTLISDCLKICKEILNQEFKEYYKLPSDFIAENTIVVKKEGLKEAEYKIVIAQIIEQVERNCIPYKKPNPKKF